MANQMSGNELGKVCQLMDFLGMWHCDSVAARIVVYGEDKRAIGKIEEQDGRYVFFPSTHRGWIQ